MPEKRRLKLDEIKTVPVKMRGAKEPKNVLIATRVARRLRIVGRAMLVKETRELGYMIRLRGQHERALKAQFADHRLTNEEMEAQLKPLDEKIDAKVKRLESITEKRARLLGPRLDSVSMSALNDPFFDYIYGHEAFSLKAKEMFSSSKSRPVQTVAMVDMDKLKDSNTLFGHVRGGAVLLGCYAEAAKSICEKYGGFTARYGADEFTFHFPLPAEKVQEIMLEYQGIARENLMKSPLAYAVEKRKIPGTATGAIIQVDFGFQLAHKQNPEQIYKNVMEQVSRKLIAMKSQGRRGRLLEKGFSGFIRGYNRIFGGKSGRGQIVTLKENELPKSMKSGKPIK
ncbi:MAG: diguanylate cyclase [archaeon]